MRPADRTHPKRPRQAKCAWGLVCLLCLALCGCASTIDHGESYQTRRYLGWLEVLEHRRQQQINIERVQATGLRIGPGLGIGHFDDRRIELPLDCHLIVVVKSIFQWQQLLTAYPQLQQQEMKPCVKPLDH